LYFAIYSAVFYYFLAVSIVFWPFFAPKLCTISFSFNRTVPPQRTTSRSEAAKTGKEYYSAASIHAPPAGCFFLSNVSFF